MAYILSTTDNSRTITIPDGVIDQTTYSIALLGRNVSNYGQYIAQNSIRTLENFASETAPSPGTRLEGQLWYDKAEKVLKVWDGTTWKRSTGIVVSNARPTTSLAAGGAWLDTKDNKLKVYDGLAWRESSYGGQISTDYNAIASVGSPTRYGSRLRCIFLKDDAAVDRAVLALTYSHDGGAQTVGTGITSIPNQGRETIMLIISDHDEFLVGNFPSITEGETVNYYQELVADPDGIAYITGPTLGKILPGLNLRGAYRNTAISLASKAEVANIAMNLNTGIYDPLSLNPTSIPAADVIHVGRGYVPNAPGFDIGGTSYPFNVGYIATLKLGDTITGGVEFRNPNIDIGNVTARPRVIYANAINMTGDITGVNNVGSSADPAAAVYADAVYVADSAGLPGILQVGTNSNRYRFPAVIGTVGQTLVVSSTPNLLEFADANVNAAASNNQVFVALTNSATTTITQAVSGGPSAVNVTKTRGYLGKSTYAYISLADAPFGESLGGFNGSANANIIINGNADWVAGSAANDIVARNAQGSFKANVITATSVIVNGVSLAGLGINVAGCTLITSGNIRFVAGGNITLTQAANNDITISATGGGGGGATNLTQTNSATTLTINSDTGTDVTMVAVTGIQAGIVSAAQHNTIFVANIITVNGVANTIGGNITLTTTNIAEGASNLYFSNARVSSAILAGNGIVFTVNSGVTRINAEVNVSVVQSSTTVTLTNAPGGGLKNNIIIPAANATHAGVMTSAAFSALSGANTFTVNGVSNTVGNTVTITTTDIAEGANLYFSNTRVRNAFTNSHTTTVTGTSPTSVNVTKTPGTLGKSQHAYFELVDPPYGESFGGFNGSANANIVIVAYDFWEAATPGYNNTIVSRSATGSFTGNVITCNTLISYGDVIAFYGTPSDSRLKTNVQVISNALDKVDQIGGYTFDWTSNTDYYTGHDVGVIAQEVELVLPELVTTKEDGYKGVKYERLTALLLAAVKELKAEVDELRAEVNALKGL